MSEVEAVDVYGTGLARGAGGPLGAFNEAGVLDVSDVHVARCLARLGGTADGVVELGAAFAARAPRLGNVCVDLATIHATADADTDAPADLAALPWPDPGTWPERMASSPLVGEDRPLHLEGTTLYLDRLWADEQLVAADLLARAAFSAEDVDRSVLSSRLDAWFDEADAEQRLAAATAVLRRVTVIAGGPGTGKTTTVAKVLALLASQAAATGARPPLIALAAPTGKAAARLEEAVRDGVPEFDVDAATWASLGGLRGMTLHRLLGHNPGNRTRFRHNRENRLPHDVVVVDETSMVSLSLMARLLEAVRPSARLVLVGDPEQLASVEAGAVLGDIVGPALLEARTRADVAVATGAPTGGERAGSSFGTGVVVLRRLHRFGGAIAALAQAVRHGDADEVVSILRAGDPDVVWIVPDAGPPSEVLADVRAVAVERGRRVVELARAGAAREAIGALGSFRLLCGHRRGPDGVAAWSEHVTQWLKAEVDGFSAGPDWYVGRPLIVTENDYALQLYNGDTGVVVETQGGRLLAAFERSGAVAEISPTRLAAVDTVYAMTVHKSQGSQYDTVAFVVPAAESRVLTRELLYTAVTRAQRLLYLVGSEESIRTAVARPIARASGLRRALWGVSA
ncbi:MAG TPA: exodeoxyribonuclease V subunit alpha [Acidimicrobiales bacterium]|nr:exodeoxyribonuclease V subunit alpha [Acidimicrobiales bacterium]